MSRAPKRTPLEISRDAWRQLYAEAEADNRSLRAALQRMPAPSAAEMERPAPDGWDDGSSVR